MPMKAILLKKLGNPFWLPGGRVGEGWFHRLQGTSGDSVGADGCHSSPLRTSSLPRFMSSMKYLCASAAFGCLLGMLVRAWGLRLDRYLWLVSVAAMLFGSANAQKMQIVWGPTGPDVSFFTVRIFISFGLRYIA